MKKENNLLENLLETQEVVDCCDGDSNSELCIHCPYTDFGDKNNYSSHPRFGQISCEGSCCEEAKEYVEDDLICDYQERKDDLKMKKANMNLNIDLEVLEQNVVKMISDQLGDNIINTLVNKLMKDSDIKNEIKNETERKIDKIINNQMNDISDSDIYNIKVKRGEEEINLFEFMVSQIVNKAKEKELSLNQKFDDIVNGMVYTVIEEEYDEDEFKVLVTESEDGISININGDDKFEVFEGEKEDMTLNRNLNDIIRVPDLIKEAYLAGKNGKTFWYAEQKGE